MDHFVDAAVGGWGTVPVRLGIHTHQQRQSFETCSRLWQRAEALGYDVAFLHDHLLSPAPRIDQPCLESLTLLTGLLDRTSRLRGGVLVVCAAFRNPALLAKMAITIDHLSAGRLELGLGAGWWDLEHRQYGYQSRSPRERGQALVEAASILRLLWTERAPSFNGQYHRIEEARCEPKPLRGTIPLWIGGWGERFTLRAVAELADGWNTYFAPVPTYRKKLEILSRHCEEFDRDPKTVRKSMVLRMIVGSTEAERRQHLERLARDEPEEAAAVSDHGVVGSPDACVEQLMPYLELGVADFLVVIDGPGDLPLLESIAQEVAPRLRSVTVRPPSTSPGR